MSTDQERAAFEAKPCPFCGESGVTVQQGSTFRWRYAICDSCGAQAGEVRVQTLGAGTKEQWEAKAHADAIEEWNRRASAKSEPAESADALLESDFEPVYCVPDGEGRFEHHARRVPLADQEVLYRSLRYMPSELAAAQARASELAAAIAQHRSAPAERPGAESGIRPYPNNPGRWLSDHRPGLNFPSYEAAYADKHGTPAEQPAPAKITWDEHGRRLVNGELASEHKQPAPAESVAVRLPPLPLTCVRVNGIPADVYTAEQMNANWFAGYRAAIAEQARPIEPYPARKVGGTFEADGRVLAEFDNDGTPMIAFKFDALPMIHLYRKDQIAALAEQARPIADQQVPKEPGLVLCLDGQEIFSVSGPGAWQELALYTAAGILDALEAAQAALRWYRDEAAALAKHMSDGAHTQAVLASVTVLSLDAGRRADAALAETQPDAEGQLPHG